MTKIITFEENFQLEVRNLKADYEFGADAEIVSLEDPLTKELIKIPVTGELCFH